MTMMQSNNSAYEPNERAMEDFMAKIGKKNNNNNNNPQVYKGAADEERQSLLPSQPRQTLSDNDPNPNDCSGENRKIITTTAVVVAVVPPSVAASPPHVRRRFYRLVLLIELGMLIFTLGVTYGSVRTETARHVLHERAWIYLVVLGSVILVMFLFVCTRRYRGCCGRSGEVVVLLLTTLVFTSLLCILTVYLKTDVFLRATLLATALLVLVVFLTFAPCCTMNSTAIVAYVLFWGLAGGILIVFIPNRWFFEHPGEDWTDPPAAVVETLLLMMLAIMFAIHLVRDLHRMTLECVPDDYVHAALQIYVDMIFVFPVLYRLASNGCDHCLDIQEQAASVRFGT